MAGMEFRNFQSTLSAPFGNFLSDRFLYFFFFFFFSELRYPLFKGRSHGGRPYHPRANSKSGPSGGNQPWPSSPWGFHRKDTTLPNRGGCTVSINSACCLPSIGSHPGGRQSCVWGLQCGKRAASEQTQTMGALLTHISPPSVSTRQSVLLSPRLFIFC